MNLVFYPELFECRNELMEALLDADLRWLSSYSSVDIDHEHFMLEICGIHTEDEAEQIRRVARRRFQGSYYRQWFKDFGRETGWIVELYLPRPRNIQ